MPLPKLSITEITDQYVRKNFERLRDFFGQESPLLGFKGFQIRFTNPVTHYKFKHNLGFLPQDVFFTSQSGAGTAVHNSSLATATDLDFTITGTVTQQTPLTIRFFAGTYNPGAF